MIVIQHFTPEVLASVKGPEKEIHGRKIKEEETKLFESWLCHLPAMQPWTRYLTLCLCFLISKTGIINTSLTELSEE